MMFFYFPQYLVFQMIGLSFLVERFEPLHNPFQTFIRHAACCTALQPFELAIQRL